jgi:glycosyltransferase involved in cell wall biosynthesis
MNLSLHLPVNSVSFGQVSTSLLREMHKRGLEPCLFPVGNVDINCQPAEKDFSDWIDVCVKKSQHTHNRKTPIFKLWHINGSLESFSERQVLFTFYELDQPTETELNIIKNNSRVLVSNEETKDILTMNGADNVGTVPLAFDDFNFKILNKKYFSDERIVFNLTGKFEKRKHHVKAIRAWIKTYGNNPKYFLQCAIWNPFLKPEDNNQIVQQIMEGKEYFNVNFLGSMEKNSVYNDFLNSADVVIAMSGGEGWGLPEFHSVAMGKHAVVLNCSGYKQWANKENSVLVEPKNKIEVYDNMFFRKGENFNQGNIYDFDDEDFIKGCERVVERLNKNRINEEGMKLQEKFTYGKMLDSITEELKALE